MNSPTPPPCPPRGRWRSGIRARYPLPWSVQTWLSGHGATVEDPAGSNAFAQDLAQLIAAMRAADTRGDASTAPVAVRTLDRIVDAWPAGKDDSTPAV